MVAKVPVPGTRDKDPTWMITAQYAFGDTLRRRPFYMLFYNLLESSNSTHQEKAEELHVSSAGELTSPM